MRELENAVKYPNTYIESISNRDLDKPEYSNSEPRKLFRFIGRTMTATK